VYHPDVTSGSSEKFLEIKEAYDYLIQNHKKKIGSYNKVWSEMFKTMAKGKNNQQVVIVRCSTKQAYEGFSKDLSIFLEIPCNQCTPLTRSICRRCDGVGFKKKLIKQNFIFNNITQQDQNFIYCDFHEGVDLCVKVHTEAPEGFYNKGRNIESIETISIFKAMLGGDIQVRTLEGHSTLTLPEARISDYSLILNGKGLFGGDHLIKLKVFLTKNLTNKQKEILNDLLNEENTKDI
jgi:DnaJ-class molecular chaperone